MKNTEIVLIEILSAFVNSRKPKIATDCSAGELYELAKAQSVTGIVSYVLRKNSKNDLLSGDKRLEQAFDKTVSQFIRKEMGAEVLIQKLSNAQIPHIIFKGLVVRECYPVQELRTYGDIDIIIREADREKCHKLMIDMNYEATVMDGGAVYGYKKGKDFFEIHTTLNSERTKLSQIMSNYWDHTVNRTGYTYEFEKNFHLCCLISHIEKHVYGTGAGIRMYLDIALFINKYIDEIDLEKVREILRECKIEKFFDTVLYLCRRLFDTDVTPKENLSEDIYEEFLRVILRGGTFGDKGEGSVVDEEMRKALKENGRVNKFTLLMHHIFPPYREVRRIYPFFNGKPYLLPAAWCVHLVKGTKRSGLKNIKRVVSADASQAQKEKELLEKIGSKR